MYKLYIGEGLSYEYELVESRVRVPAENRVLIVVAYGIKITAIDKDGGEFSQVYDKISPYRDKVEQLVDRFAGLALSPYHLYEVLDDIVEMYIDDFELYAFDSISDHSYRSIDMAI
ncbi:DUF6514 family protein [Caldanaerobius polysaccharolyticus]|uniref:DUF6514 family protein n=1 Tax=Caldanaerobius polysaccharolyticus TaxID=44256 RepID=UPI00054F9682|nr:DUF6514 family protein [Caldanaerobius polysaccharolyticus]